MQRQTIVLVWCKRSLSWETKERVSAPVPPSGARHYDVARGRSLFPHWWNKIDLTMPFLPNCMRCRYARFDSRVTKSFNDDRICFIPLLLVSIFDHRCKLLIYSLYVSPHILQQPQQSVFEIAHFTGLNEFHSFVCWWTVSNLMPERERERERESERERERESGVEREWVMLTRNIAYVSHRRWR